MSNQIGMDTGFVLGGASSLNTGYRFRFILGIQSLWIEPKPMNKWKCREEV